LKRDGRRHSPGEHMLLRHVAQEFKKIKKSLGAKKAAIKLGVSLASFYKYVRGQDLPRMEVLGRAHELWGINWPMMDAADFLQTHKVRSAEQLAFSFLEAVREADVEIVKVDLKRNGILQVKLKIHLPDSRVKSAPVPA
jgi:predicted DNA-binding transcriptional regulator AlpA